MKGILKDVDPFDGILTIFQNPDPFNSSSVGEDRIPAIFVANKRS